MLADFLTKPLPGRKLKTCRHQLMGCSKPFNLLGGDESSSTLKECVGTVPDGTKNNIVDQVTYNCYLVLGEIDLFKNMNLTRLTYSNNMYLVRLTYSKKSYDFTDGDIRKIVECDIWCEMRIGRMREIRECDRYRERCVTLDYNIV